MTCSFARVRFFSPLSAPLKSPWKKKKKVGMTVGGSHTHPRHLFFPLSLSLSTSSPLRPSDCVVCFLRLASTLHWPLGSDPTRHSPFFFFFCLSVSQVHHKETPPIIIFRPKPRRYHTLFNYLMATLSSPATSSTLSRLSNSSTVNNNNNNNTSIAHNGPGTATPMLASLGADPDSSHAGLKAATDARGPPAGQSGQKGSKKVHAVGRDTKSLDYVTKTMLAGGIAGITVRQNPFPLLSLNSAIPPSLSSGRLICHRTDG